MTLQKFEINFSYTVSAIVFAILMAVVVARAANSEPSTSINDVIAEQVIM